jgi:hypothetical protein
LEPYPQSKVTVLAFYDDEKPNLNPFQKFLDIDHGGTLKNVRYTSGNIDDNPEIPDGGGDLEGPFPRPIIGTGVMNARCVAIEII